LTVNRKSIVVAGINRHEFDCRLGRAVSKLSMLQDIQIMKRLNFNAVRSSHYPQHSFWLELCDEMGLYFINEANIETHGFQALGMPLGYLADRVEWFGNFAARISRMYERDKNHVCIIGWSLGNEAGYGKIHQIMYEWLHIRDPSRFVQVR
jgi:beta-galactosidase